MAVAPVTSHIPSKWILSNVEISQSYVPPEADYMYISICTPQQVEQMIGT